MKRINRIILICLVCLTSFAVGCVGNAPANENQAGATNSQASSTIPGDAAEANSSPGSQSRVRPMPGAPTPAPEPGAESEAKPPPTLVGTYSVVEVHHKGMIDMIAAENTTEINFTPEGKFLRLSKKGGRIDHTDAGDFRVEGQDQLILVIYESKQKIQNPPVVRRHKIELSPDGTELRMVSNKGMTAMFRKTSPLPGR
jgi:hypothetical protein